MAATCHEDGDTDGNNSGDDDGDDERDGNGEGNGELTCAPLSSAIVADTLGRRWRLHSPLSGVTVILQNALSLVDVSADAPGFARPFSFRTERRTLRFAFHRLRTILNPSVRVAKKMNKSKIYRTVSRFDFASHRPFPSIFARNARGHSRWCAIRDDPARRSMKIPSVYVVFRPIYRFIALQRSELRTIYGIRVSLSLSFSAFSSHNENRRSLPDSYLLRNDIRYIGWTRDRLF